MRHAPAATGETLVRRYGWLALVGAIVCSSGCKPSLRGRLHGTVDGHAVEYRSAFTVPHGGRSYTLFLSTAARDCAWAMGRGVGTIEPGEASVTVELAPILGRDGTARWQARGGGWLGDSHAGFGVGNLGWATWSAQVTAPATGCPSRVVFDGKPPHRDGSTDEKPPPTLDGEVAPLCCASAVPDHDAPMTLRLGHERYPLARGWIERSGSDGTQHLRLTRDGAPCSNMVTHEDVVLDLFLDGQSTAARSLHATGLTLPLHGLLSIGDATLPLTVDEHDRLRVHGHVAVRPFGDFDGPTLDAALDGEVALTRCAAPAR